MSFFNFLKPKKSESVETFLCVKCGKNKAAENGVFIHEGKNYCCSACCGDLASSAPEEKKTNVCDFC